jgi:hypothetical protein
MSEPECEEGLAAFGAAMNVDFDAFGAFDAD